MAQDFLEEFGLHTGLDGEGGVGVAAVVGGHALNVQGLHQGFPIPFCVVGIGVVAGVAVYEAGTA